MYVSETYVNYNISSHYILDMRLRFPILLMSTEDPPLRIRWRPIDNGAGASFLKSAGGTFGGASRYCNSLFTIMLKRMMAETPQTSI